MGLSPRIGLLGGSFDPIHPGHVALGRAAALALGLTRIRLMPVARSWQKAQTNADAQQRLAMLQLALQDEGLAMPASDGACQWQIDRQEIDRGPPTYTIDTLLALRAELRANGQGDTPLVLIIGSDQFARIDTWHRWEELLDHCHIAVTTRLPVLLTQIQGAALALLQDKGVPALPQAPAGKITTFRMQAVHLSSTQVRDLLARDRALGLGLLHPSVAAYIAQHGLYPAA